jgi:RHS repeat-associated protein
VKRAFALAAALVTAPLLAQHHPNLERGFTPEKMYQFNGLDTVALYNGNLMITLPLGQSYPVDAGLEYSFTLVYNSKVWDYATEPVLAPDGQSFIQTAAGYPNRRSNAGLGWSLSPGRFFDEADPNNDGSFDLYEDPSGAEHPFHRRLHVEDPGATYDCYDTQQGAACNPSSTLRRVAYSQDATYIRQKKFTNGTRTLQFPNGDLHTFDSHGRLSSVHDSFGNSYSLSYVLSSGSIDAWTLTDKHGRTQTAFFRTISNSQKNYKRVLDRLVLSAFPQPNSPQATATYQFLYDDSVTIPRGCNSAIFPDTVQVPLLRRIILPDGSSYHFTYNHTGPTGCDQGTLASMTLPTLGRYEWTYQLWNLPLDECNPALFNPSSGVRFKRDFAPGATAPIATWEYRQEIAGPVEDVACVNPPETAPPETFYTESRTTVVSPSKDQTTHFFSAWPRQNPSPAGFRVEELGLPFTRRVASGDQYLSTQSFDCPSQGCNTNAGAVRSTYLRYEGEVKRHPRVAASRTVFHDDSDRYVETDHSDFDGYGHYRTSRSRSTLGDTERRLTVRYNLGSDGSGRSGFHLFFPYFENRWLLNTFDRKSITEGVDSAVEDFCFDFFTGFLRGHRLYKDSGVIQPDASVEPAPSANDVITRYTSTKTSGNAEIGNVETENWYGGDRSPIATSNLCTTTMPASEYRVTHGYVFGVRSSSQHRNVPWKLLDRDVDSRTGLVPTSRDPSGLATTYSFDVMARLTSFRTTGLEPVTYQYTPAAPASGTPNDGVPDLAPMPARVAITYGDPLVPRPADTQSALQFDWFGRLWREHKRMPDQTWSVRESLYHPTGSTASVSMFETLVVPTRPPNAPPDQPNPSDLDFAPQHKTRFDNHDPFGRPQLVTTADNRTTTASFDGIRISERTVSIAMAAGETPVTTREERDSRGNLRTIIEAYGTADALSTVYSYDLRDRLTSVAIGAQQRHFQYDGRGFLTEEQHPELGPAGHGTIQYKSHDSRGVPWRKITGTVLGPYDLLFTYDPAGRLTAVHQNASGRPVKQFAYDHPAGTPANPCIDSLCGKLAASARFHYDPALANVGAGESIVVTEARQYNGAAGLISRRDWLVGNAHGNQSLFTTSAFAAAQTYTSHGHPENTIYPCRTVSTACVGTERERSVPSSYTRGALTGVTGYASNITYRPSGAIDTVTHGSGASALREIRDPDPDGLGRPARIRALTAAGAELWSSGTYLYDGSGNIRQIGSVAYAYDALQRLTAWGSRSPDGAYSETVRGYDVFGNYLQTMVAGCGPGGHPCYSTTVMPHEMNGTTNRYAAQSYDEAGNVVSDKPARTFQYDAAGSLVRNITDGRDFHFFYTADDERIAVVEMTAPKRYTYTVRGVTDQLLSTWKTNPSTGALQWSEDLVWRGGELLANITPTATRHYTLDHLGSPRAVTAISSPATLVGVQSFDSFGEGGTLDGGPLQFTGHERDKALFGNGSVDLPDYFHARYYEPGLGRFLSVDPVMDSVDPARPQSWNRYAYVMNNPMNATDPTGLYTVNCGSLSADDCKTQTDGFEASLNGQRSSRDSQVAEAAGVYGALGDDNGVVVEFVANLTHSGSSADGTHFPSFGVDASGKATINHNIQIATGLSSSDMALAAVHEGRHALTANAFGRSVIAGSPNDALNLSMYDAEMAAYLLTGRFVNANNTNNGRGVEYNGLRVRPGTLENVLRRDIDRYLRRKGITPGNRARGMCQWSAFCAD